MTIQHHGKTIELVKYVEGGRKAGSQRMAAGEDSTGRVYFLSRKGSWTVAYQTLELARKMLSTIK